MAKIHTSNKIGLWHCNNIYWTNSNLNFIESKSSVYLVHSFIGPRYCINA